MEIGERLKTIREEKNLSQGDIEKRTGLLRCYLSRVENGHTVPAVETIEKIAQALGVPMYSLFYEGEKPPEPRSPKSKDAGWGSSRRDARILDRFRRLIGRMNQGDQKLLFRMAQTMAGKNRRPAST